METAELVSYNFPVNVAVGLIYLLITLSQLTLLWVLVDSQRRGHVEQDFAWMVMGSDLLVGVLLGGFVWARLFSASHEWTPALCNYSQIATAFACELSIVSLTIFSASRYWLVVRHANVPKWVLAAFASWTCLHLIVLCLPAIMGRVSKPAPAEFYCMLDWADKEGLMFFVILWVLSVLFSCTFLIAFFYYRIYSTIMEVSRQVQQLKTEKVTALASTQTEKTLTPTIPNQPSNSADKKKVPRIELLDRATGIAIKRSALIVATFLACWTPYMITMFYEIFTSTKVSTLCDIVVSFLAISNSFWNFVIFIRLNGNYKKSFLRMLGFSSV